MSLLTTPSPRTTWCYQLQFNFKFRKSQTPLLLIKARGSNPGNFRRHNLRVHCVAQDEAKSGSGESERRRSGDSWINLNASSVDAALSDWFGNSDPDDSGQKNGIGGILGVGLAGVLLFAGITSAAISMGKRSSSRSVQEMKPLVEQQEVLLSSEEEVYGDKENVNDDKFNVQGESNGPTEFVDQGELVDDTNVESLFVSENPTLNDLDASAEDNLQTGSTLSDVNSPDMVPNSAEISQLESVDGSYMTSTSIDRQNTIVVSETEDRLDARLNDAQAGAVLLNTYEQQETFTAIQADASNAAVEPSTSVVVPIDIQNVDHSATANATLGTDSVPGGDKPVIASVTSKEDNEVKKPSIFDSQSLRSVSASRGIPAPSLLSAALMAPPGKVLVPAVADQTQSQALTALQVLKVIESDAQSGDLCTRREYARWLVSASSALSRNLILKVYPAMYIENVTELAFDDITPEDPDFSFIQGLAEAGLISSKLSRHDMLSSPDEDIGSFYFHPDSPLSRQDLVTWKMALEKRQLPEADRKDLHQLSGFIDIDRIDPDACPALVADLSASEQGIVALAFGYTRLFQPDKPVTKGQAAIALANGEAADLVSEELARIEAESIADKAVATHNALMAEVEKDINANFEMELLMEKDINANFDKDGAVHEVEQIKTDIAEIDTNASRMKSELQELDAKVSELTAEKEASMGGEIKTLQEKVYSLAQDLVKETSVLKNKEDTLKGEQKNADKVAKNIEELKQSVEERAAAVKNAEDGAADLKQKAQELSKELDGSEKEYQGVLAGKSSQDEEKCLEDQLADAKAAVGNAEIEVKQLKTQITHGEKELVEKTNQLKSKRNEATAVENELNTRKKEVEAVRKSLDSLPFKEDQNSRMEALQQERAAELEEVQKLKDKIRALSGQLSNVDFTYRDPTKNFERSKVKGVVAKLIKIKDGSTMTALEVVAGGRLFNVVVDTETTGKQLLQNGDLRRRVTIIPLNKIQAHVIAPDKQRAASNLVGKENAKLALSLVEYDEELKRAMEYVFGSTFVCKTREAAVKVAFNKDGNIDVREPCVTLEGDIFQPSGLLTGGSRRGGGELLGRLCALADAETDLSTHQKRLSEIEVEIAQLLPLQKKLTDLNNQLKLKEYELELFKGRAEQNEHHKLGEMLKKIEQDLSVAKSTLKEKQAAYENCVKKVSTLEKSIKDYDKSRGARLKDLEKKIKALKSQMQSSSKDLKGHENQREKLIMEMEAVAEERTSLASQLDSLQTQIQSLVSEINEQKVKVASIKEHHDEALSNLNAARSKLKECDSQISCILKEQQKLQNKISDASLERKKMENEVKRMEEEQKECSLKVDRLVEKHSWIASEKQLFGRSGSDYDFASRDPRRAREELERLQGEQSSLEKRVNKKVMAMFEKAEDEYNDLISKKNIIENDKAKIKKVIEELDEKKKETLKVTWVKVNNDFGSIFSTLLPGTTAKLEPPEGCSFLDGLEVRVAFGGVWKQSLSELSGGQRSLLALSLILALLLFKPAPLYILDEVDAALDLSHTQNIGRMIKTHFPQSQFIVVSLKEGMFNNANVIFRTKFVDGVSTVQRTATAKQK